MTPASQQREWNAEAPQAEFLQHDDVDEALYGGARQGGKSDALLIFSIVRRQEHPGSKGLILRRTLADLHKEGALIPRSHELFQGIASYHTQEHKWRFPDGGVIEFAHCEHDDDVYGFQGSQYDDICIDQAEQFTDWQFRLLRPVARTVRKDLKPLIRLTANPGGRGHTWLKQGFVDPAPPGTVHIDPDTQKTRVYVPATVYDNPHVSASTIRDLEGLREPLRSAWLLGHWDVFVGQFFPEWNLGIHCCEPFAIPKDWRRFGMLDYGYAQSPLVYLQAAISPDRRIYLYREIVRLQMIDERQAEEIAGACADDPPQYIVAGPDLWNKSGKGPKGQSTAETYRRVWERLRFPAHLQMADNDRVLGWRRVRQWLAPFTAADGSGQTALLQVFEGRVSRAEAATRRYEPLALGPRGRRHRRRGAAIMAQERKVKFSGVNVAMVAFISCPDCDTPAFVTLSFLKLEGAFLCQNPQCGAQYGLRLTLPDREKAKTDEMLRLARASNAQSRSLDWSHSEIHIGPLDPGMTQYRRPTA